PFERAHARQSCFKAWHLNLPQVLYIFRASSICQTRALTYCNPYVNYYASALIEQNDVYGAGGEACYASRPDDRLGPHEMPGSTLRCGLWETLKSKITNRASGPIHSAESRFPTLAWFSGGTGSALTRAKSRRGQLFTRRRRTPRPPPLLIVPSLMNSTPAAWRASITFISVSMTPRTTPSLVSMRWIVGSETPERAASVFCSMPTNARAAFICAAVSMVFLPCGVT